MIMLAFAVIPTQSANAETRKLKLYYLHTGEKAEITFKKNGRYVKSGLKKINRFLRDWRRNEPTKMNPRLLDLIWEVYKETRSRKHIHVISGYRSPATNSLLRKRGRGVARKSQHTLGNALDFFIPGVNLRKLRNIGLKKGLGGVGYYPKSGSPFVHMDTGRVRHWPRMNRKQLVKVFPRGKTLHVPTDGKPLPGYNIAKANYERALKGKSRFNIASAEEIKKKPSILARLFSRDNDEDAGISGASRAPKPVRAKKIKPAKPAVKPAKPAPVIATPTPTPEVPTPTPAVVEPQPTPETVIASLTPNQIPVPISAPRIAVVKPQEVEVPEVAETQVASLELVETQEETSVNEAELQAAAFAIPVPAKRPSVDVGTTPTLALADATPTSKPVLEVAALSANEISDLRQQVYATLESDQTVTPSDIPFKPATQIAEQIPFQPPTPLEQSDLPSVIQSASSAIEGQIVTPEQTVQPNNPQLVTALLPLEPDLKKTSGINIPTKSPNLNNATQATQEPIKLEETNVAAVNDVPVPQPALRPSIALANARSAAVEKIQPLKPTANTTSDPAVTPRKKTNGTLSSEEFKTANLDERLTGKWALAADSSIKDIADIRPPAYGRSLLRELPSAVLSSGFSQTQIGERTSGFAGSSLEFLEFKNFK